MKDRRRAFSLMELMVATTIAAVVLVCVFTGVTTLQRSYAATEAYATGQADQERLLDFLALDLRRGIQITGSLSPYVMDADGQGLKINVPDYYLFNATDPQHLQPMAVSPAYDPGTGTAFYNSGGGAPMVGTVPYQVVAYRFRASDGAITRRDPWAPLVSNGSGGYKAAAPVVIASGMTAFPTLTPDPGDFTGNTVRYAVTFHAAFQPLTNATTGTQVTLHNVTFIRSKNLVR